jgi:nucleotide-binding universal stress UspA family protein
MKPALDREDVAPITSIVHMTDLSSGGESAFAHALGLAVLRQTELVLLNVGARAEKETDWKRFPGIRDTLVRWGLLEEGSHKSEVFRRLKVRAEKVQLSASNTLAATVEFVEQYQPDLMVLGTEGREGLPRWLKPSMAEQIAVRAGEKTLFVPNDARPLISLEDGSINLKNVLVPVDHAPAANDAMVYAARICELLLDEPANIHLLHVGEAMPNLALPQSPAYTFTHALEAGEPLDVILSYVENNDIDLVAMTTAGSKNLSEVLSGGTTQQVLRGVDCPLLAVPAE